MDGGYRGGICAYELEYTVDAGGKDTGRRSKRTKT
jgi:hypothetical protein